MAEKYSMKDDFFNAKTVNKIACEIETVYDNFEREAFEKEIVSKFPELELKERIFHIRDMFKKYLPDDYVVAINILLDALPKELDPLKKDDDFGDFIYSPYSEYIAEFGCTKEHLDFSLLALREMTKRFSVEFSIRDFINNFPKETLKMLHECSLSDNYHQRRVASEGLRIKLPWAKKIEIDYCDNFPILENLYFDNTRYVTRSVANHLNDISKIDALLVLETLKRWKASKKQDKKEMEFIINHSLRTLVKDGDKDALLFLGFCANPKIEVKNFNLKKSEVIVGEAVEFDFEIVGKKDERLIVDYILHFQTKSGKLNPKVHKIKKLSIKSKESIKIVKKHPFKANMTTRKLYTGMHKIELQINGKSYGSLEFHLS